MARTQPSRSKRGAPARSSWRQPADVPPAPRVEIAAKQRKSGKPAPRVSRHKKRAAWFRRRVSWPMREASRARRVRRAAARVAHAARGDTGQRWARPVRHEHRRPMRRRWSSIRPTPTASGSAPRAAACGGAPTPAARGRSSGARARRWRSASLAIDPTTPGRRCTAAPARRTSPRDSYPGRRRLSVDQRRHDVDSRGRCPTKTGLPRRIGTIAVDPFDSEPRARRRHRLRPRVERRRLRRPLPHDQDGGTTWRRLTFISANNYWCHAVVFDAGDAAAACSRLSPGPARRAASTGPTTAARAGRS